jgi:hypothetical protein
MRALTPAERIDGYLRCGVDIYITGEDRLRVRGARRLVSAALPAIRVHRDELLAYLKVERAAAVQRIIVSATADEEQPR